MEKTTGSITSDYMGGTKEEFLFTYSEEEKLQNEVNKNNAGLIFYADFYPLYTGFIYSNLSLIECVILSYLYYWTKNGKWIYASNDELAKLTKSSRAVITKTLKHLSDLGYIDMKIKRIVGAGTDRKMKINVDMMRNLISNTNSDHTELISSSQTTQNEQSDYSNGVVIKEYIEKNNKEKEIKEKEKDTLLTSSSKNDMLEMFRNDPTLTRCMNEEDVIKWWDFKQASKKPYKDVGSFKKALVKIKNILKFRPDGYPNSDRERKNRFNYAVDEAIEGRWEGLDWYDKMEKAYELSKDDLYPN